MSFAKDLRASVLQAAMQGKLTEQWEIDTPVSQLLQETQHATDVLKQEYKLKRSKPLLEIAHEPFDIPDSWKWTRLGAACAMIFSGKSPTYSPDATRYVCIGQKNNQEYGIDFNGEKYLTLDFAETIPAYQFLQTNDVLLNTLGTGTVGRSGIWNNEKENVCTDGHLMVMRTVYPETARYLLYILRMRRTEIENSADGSTNQKFLKLEDVRNYLIPLPPIEEQKRIVQRIDEIMTLIDELEAIENELTRLKAAFPGDMKAAVLQAAMQGKLTEQLETDGSVDKLLAKINAEREQLINEGKIKKPKAHQNDNFVAFSDGEAPLEIPGNWGYVNLLNVATTVSDKSYQIKQNAILKDGLYPVVSQSQNYIEGYCNQKDKVLKHDTPFLVFGDHSKTIKHIDFDFVIGADGTKILYPFIDSKFLYYCLLFNINKLPTKSYGRHFGLLSEIPIVLPPLEEQNRIVEKLEQIFPLISDLY